MLTEDIEYTFWLSDTRGLIRQRRPAGSVSFPELWNGKEWVAGSAYVMDAITGMGEDPYSCGEWADKLTAAQAEEYARLHNVDLYAPNIDSR